MDIYILLRGSPFLRAIWLSFFFLLKYKMSAYTGILCNILCYTFEVPLRSYASAKKSKEIFAYISVCHGLA